MKIGSDAYGSSYGHLKFSNSQIKKSTINDEISNNSNF